MPDTIHALMATIATTITKRMGRKALMTRLTSLLRDDIRPDYGFKRRELQKEKVLVDRTQGQETGRTSAVTRSVRER